MTNTRYPIKDRITALQALDGRGCPNGPRRDDDILALIEHVRVLEARLLASRTHPETKTRTSAATVESESVMTDDYAIAAFVKHYQIKNDYSPTRELLETLLRSTQGACTQEDIDRLVKDDVLSLQALYEGGPPIFVGLTEKGWRMAAEASQHARRVKKRREKEVRRHVNKGR